MRTNNDNLVEIVNLGKIYKNGSEELHILRGVDLKIARGSSILISGESGSGKSTLLNLIGGLDRPSYGSVKVGDFMVDHGSEEEMTAYRNQQVGFIFQFHYLMKDFSALENTMLPAFMGGEAKEKALKRAAELLERVELGDREDFYPSQLSGGERQRVAVARALINEPDIVLADEPTGNLDEKHSEIVAELLFDLSKFFETTLVVVSHDLSLAKRADRHLRLNEGVLKG
ncbi:MAG TPA: ABC transporter ATP-binding protein [Sediminispirochaeta sp.]|nr:ABC transporter ATP-binding protein [Sediminispirochaeta sp.]